MKAAKWGQKAVTQLLLEKGVDAKAQDRDREITLMIVVRQGHKAVVQLLLKQGVDVKAQD